MLLKVTKTLYSILGVLSLSVLLIELIGSGGVSDKAVVIVVFWAGILAFVFWVFHTWIKHTKFVGFALFIASIFLSLCKYFSII